MGPRISVIIPVYREEGRINALIDHVRMRGYGHDPEIVIVDGDPGRNTLAAVDRGGVVAVPASKGRGRQLNAGAAASRGEILLFLHADCGLPAGAFEAVTGALLDGAAAGAFRFGVRSRKWRYRLIEAGARCRNALTRTPYGDQAQFTRRDVFTAVGGFPETPIMEDVAFMRRVKRAYGRSKIALLPLRTLVSPRRWEAEGALYCVLRNQYLIVSYLLGVSPERLAGLYPPLPDGESDGMPCGLSDGAPGNPASAETVGQPVGQTSEKASGRASGHATDRAEDPAGSRVERMDGAGDGDGR